MLSSSSVPSCSLTEAPHVGACDDPLQCCVPCYMLLGEPYSCPLWDPLNKQSTLNPVSLPWVPLFTHVHVCYRWEAPSLRDVALTVSRHGSIW